MRLMRAILILGLLDLWMVNRSAHGQTALPQLPHLDL